MSSSTKTGQPALEYVLSYGEARACVEQHAAGLSSATVEQVDLLASVGRVLAEDIAADRDLPPFPRATRDGYAVRSSDLTVLPARLRVLAQIKAGATLAPGLAITSGNCAEIMTGAPVPPGADAVVMIEFTSFAANTVEVQCSVRPGENIVPAGSEARAGQIVLRRGTRIAYAQIAVAASVGRSKIQVFKRPRIAILSTGDEIVEISATPGPSQIRNSNSYSLAAQVSAAGGEPIQLAIAPDERSKLRELIAEGLKSDLLLLSGGVSMGKYDLVEEVLRESHDAEFFFTGAKIQPGKPVVFGQARAPQHPPNDETQAWKPKETYFLGLPGNPISTMVTFELFARPLIHALCGERPKPTLFTFARLKADLKTKTGLTRFLPARLLPFDANSEGMGSEILGSEVEMVPWQGSGDMVAAAQADCYLVVPPDREQIRAGEMVAILMR